MNRTTGLARCGRSWPTEASARASKRFGAGNVELATGCPCGRVHLRRTQDVTERKPARVDAGEYRHKVFSAWAKESRASGPTPAVRALVLERDQRRCVVCCLSILGRRYSLAHRLRASQGGKAVPSNLIVVHGWGGQECHGRIDNRDNPEDEERGLTIRSGGDPRLVPVTYTTPDGGFTRWLDDDGNLLSECPEVAA